MSSADKKPSTESLEQSAIKKRSLLMEEAKMKKDNSSKQMGEVTEIEIGKKNVQIPSNKPFTKHPARIGVEKQPPSSPKGIGKCSTQHWVEMPKKRKGTGGMPIKTLPKLRVGYKLNLPTMTIDNYDAWYECVESCDYREVPVYRLPLDEYNKIMKECYDGVDSEEEEVSDDQEGVIDLEDYIIALNEEDWAYKDSFKCL